MSPAPAMERAPRYAALRVGEWTVLVPQGEVEMLESAADLRPGGPPGACGTLAVPDQSVPVYAPPGAARPARVCVVLRAGAERFALLADAVTTVAGADLALHPLPGCMEPGATPVTALAVHGETVRGVSAAAELMAWVCAGADRARVCA